RLIRSPAGCVQDEGVPLRRPRTPTPAATRPTLVIEAASPRRRVLLRPIAATRPTVAAEPHFRATPEDERRGRRASHCNGLTARCPRRFRGGFRRDRGRTGCGGRRPGQWAGRGGGCPGGGGRRRTGRLRGRRP